MKCVKIVSAEELAKILSLLILPIVVYIGGRIAERLLVGAYRKWTGELVFEESTEGDMAVLTVRTNSPVVLDEVDIHLEDRLLDMMRKIKDGLKVKQNERVQFSPLDRIRLECILQEDGDRKLFTHAYIGTRRTFFEEDLSDVGYRSAVDFMRNTEVSMVTSGRTYRRNLFKRDC